MRLPRAVKLGCSAILALAITIGLMVATDSDAATTEPPTTTTTSPEPRATTSTSSASTSTTTIDAAALEDLYAAVLVTSTTTTTAPPPPPPPSTSPPAPPTTPAPTVAPTPPPASPSGSVESIVYAAAAEFGVSGDWMVCIARRESTLDPGAVNSSSGALGLFQHLPQFWGGRAANLGYGYDSWSDPTANARVTAWMVSTSGTSPWYLTNGGC